MHDVRPTDDGDFSAYVGARWPGLVRTLVLLGCPLTLAPDVAATALSRCRKGWRQASEYDDLDVVVHRALLDSWDERLRETWWSELRPRTDPGWPLPDLSTLDRMTPEVRTGLVLRRFAALDQPQAVAVAGRAAGGPLPTVPDAPALRAAGDSLVVYAPPDERDLTEAPPPWRRRRVLAIVAGAVAAALVLGGWTWWATRDDEGGRDSGSVGLDPVDPSRSRNPAGVAWYAEDVLHLANATYVLPTLRDLAVLGAGAVYGDDDGRVVYLADDGTRALLGTKDPLVPFATSDDQGWVAWVDPAGANPRLLVYDVALTEIVGELDLPASASGPQEEPDTRPVAIDQEGVYFLTSEGARAWWPTRDPGFLEKIDPPTLLDVSSSNRMYQFDTQQVLLDQPFFHTSYTVPGRGGELSEDGDFALTRNPADGEVLVYSFEEGQLVDVRPPEPLAVVDVVLAPEGAITYITIDPDGFPTQDNNDSNPIEGRLITCQLDDGECDALATLVLDSEAPILAR